MEVLGLLPSRPMTFAEAAEMADDDVHGLDNPHRLSRVFVTPEVDGWTLVIGAWCDPSDSGRRDDVLGLCTTLSVRYGSAQAYYFGGHVDGSAWLIAENGTVVRRYAATGEPDDALLTLGRPLPLEQEVRAAAGLPDGDPQTLSEDQRDELESVTFDLAPEIAAAYGVTPLTLSPGMKVRGTGLLALTPHPFG